MQLTLRTTPCPMDSLDIQPEELSPQAGDILVWRLSSSDHFGHIGICVEANGSMVTSVEQNVDGNSDYLRVGGPARLKTRNANRLVSIIRPKFDPEATKSLDEVAREVINGAWGNGSDRVARLKSAGYDPEAVQSRVNAMLSGSNSAPVKKSTDEIAKEVLAGKWGNGADRKSRLESAGYNYTTIQNRVNELAAGSTPKKSIDEVAREVIQGKWGNGSDRKESLTKAGYDYDAVQRRVNQLL